MQTKTETEICNCIYTVTDVNNERNMTGCQNNQEPNEAGHLQLRKDRKADRHGSKSNVIMS